VFRTRRPAVRVPLLLRVVWPMSSPLVRRSDRWQAVLVLLLLAAAAAPLSVTQPLQHALELRLGHAWQAEVQDRTRVEAVLLENAPLPVAQAGDTATHVLVRQSATAVWTETGGGTHSVDVPVTVGARAGDHLMIWVAPDERTALPDPQPGELHARAWAQTALAVMGWWSLLGLVHVLLTTAFERLHARWWTVQWQRTGPRWTSRA